MKTDGFPTYHFANVVDDHFMKISHVLRGEGIFPEALLNYVVDAGGGFAKDMERKTAKIYTLRELAEQNQNLQLQDDYILSVLQWGKSRTKKLEDLVSDGLAFLWIVPSQEILRNLAEDKNINVLEDVKIHLSNQLDSEFNRNQLKSILKNYASQKNVPFNKLMKLLRHAISGLKEGPGVAEMMEILGQSSTLSRLDHAVLLLKIQQSKL
ncbi:hypothetical protein C0J52_13866 [Blattella germanica]|nr:hypothetical protein C0J52_13866 [Blattella germanica]